jgi:hypothetical protein
VRADQRESHDVASLASLAILQGALHYAFAMRRWHAASVLGVTVIGVASALLAQVASAGTLGPFGLVSGELEIVGGVAPGSPRNVSGHVVFTQVATGGSYAFATNAHGTFHGIVPAATYRVTGYSPDVRANGTEARCAAPHLVRIPPTPAGPTPTIRGIAVTCHVK